MNLTEASQKAASIFDLPPYRGPNLSFMLRRQINDIHLAIKDYNNMVARFEKFKQPVFTDAFKRAAENLKKNAEIFDKALDDLGN